MEQAQRYGIPCATIATITTATGMQECPAGLQAVMLQTLFTVSAVTVVRAGQDHLILTLCFILPLKGIE